MEYAIKLLAFQHFSQVPMKYSEHVFKFPLNPKFTGDGTAVVESTFLETYYRLPIVMTPPNQGGNITVAAGDSLNLTCSAENASRRQWLARPWGGSNRDVRVVSSTSDGKITVTSDKVVLFRGIELDDGALYSCLLGNDVEMAKIEYNVTVVGESMQEYSCKVCGMPSETLHQDSEGKRWMRG